MKRIVFLILFTALNANASSIKNENTQLAKEIFFESGGIVIEQHIDSMTKMIIARQPDWVKYQYLVKVKVTGILSSESYKNKVAQIISKNFTYDDLVQLSEIMSQPVMIKWNKNSPLFLPEIAMATTDHILPQIEGLVKEIIEKERTISDGKNSSEAGKKFTSLIRNNKCNELYEYADQVLLSKPNDIEALYAKGYCRHKEKSYELAEQLFSAVFDQSGEYRRINYNLASLYLDMGKEKQAIKYAIAETQINSEDPDSFILLGILQMKNNDSINACKSFTNAEKIEPRVANFEPKIKACGL